MGEGVGVPGNIAGEFSGGKEWERGLEGLPTLPLSRLMMDQVRAVSMQYLVEYRKLLRD